MRKILLWRNSLEYLQNQVESSDSIQATAIPGLSILGAGKLTLSARQLLNGIRWQNVIEELKNQFDYLVIDTAPVLMVSDTLLMARQVDGVVLSTLLDVSQIALVSETATRLKTVGVNLLGVVVNGVKRSAYSSNYQSSYGISKNLRPINNTIALVNEQ